MKLNIFRRQDDGTFKVEEIEVTGEDFDLPLPHCDQSILHAPGKCQYCDAYPQAQAMRAHWRINYTGEHDENKAPCPSEYFRSGEVRDRWPGNTSEGYLGN